MLTKKASTALHYPSIKNAYIYNVKSDKMISVNKIQKSIAILVITEKIDQL